MKSVEVKFKIGDDAFPKELAIDGVVARGTIARINIREDGTEYFFILLDHQESYPEYKGVWLWETNLLTELEAIDEAIQVTKARLCGLEARKRMVEKETLENADTALKRDENGVLKVTIETKEDWEKYLELSSGELYAAIKKAPDTL